MLLMVTSPGRMISHKAQPPAPLCWPRVRMHTHTHREAENTGCVYRLMLLPVLSVTAGNAEEQFPVCRLFSVCWSI